MEAKGGELEFGLQIVIQCLVRLPTLAAPAQLADGDHGLGIQGQTNRAGVRVRLAIEAMHRLKDRIGLRHTLRKGLLLATRRGLNPSALSLRRRLRSEGTSAGA